MPCMFNNIDDWILVCSTVSHKIPVSRAHTQAIIFSECTLFYLSFVLSCQIALDLPLCRPRCSNGCIFSSSLQFETASERVRIATISDTVERWVLAAEAILDLRQISVLWQLPRSDEWYECGVTSAYSVQKRAGKPGLTSSYSFSHTKFRHECL